MRTLPTTIETAIQHQLLAPLAEVLAGQRPARDLEPVATRDVVLRLTLRPRKPLGPVAVRTIRAQRAAAGEALEIAAAITDQAGRLHPLGVQLALAAGRPWITAVATDLW